MILVITVYKGPLLCFTFIFSHHLTINNQDIFIIGAYTKSDPMKKTTLTLENQIFRNRFLIYDQKNFY